MFIDEYWGGFCKSLIRSWLLVAWPLWRDGFVGGGVGYLFFVCCFGGSSAPILRLSCALLHESVCAWLG